jgi:uncharacterized protein YodC (DUF2158 family)
MANIITRLEMGEMAQMTEFHPSMPFKPGEVVRLKSGGPEMTVATADKDIRMCFWFAGRKIAYEWLSIHILATHKE